MKMRRLRGVLAIVALVSTLPLCAQFMEEFDGYSWQQQDSLITVLYQGGALQVAALMIDKGYETQKAQRPVDPQALAVFSMWQGVKKLSEQSNEEALTFLKESAALYEANPSIQDSLYRDVLINVAEVELMLGRRSEASAQLQRACAFIEQQSPRNEETLLSLYQRIVEIELAESNVTAAEEYGRKALQQAQDKFGNDSEYYFRALYMLGQVYQGKGQGRRASNLILQAYQLAKTYLEDDNLNLVFYGSAAAREHQNLGQYQAAEKAYDEVLSFFDNNPEVQDNLLFPRTMDQVGSFYELLGDYEKAHELYDRANILFTLRADRVSPEYILSQGNMARILRLQEKYTEAEGYYQGALTYAPAVFGDTSWTVGYLKDNLGEVYYQLGDYAQALEQKRSANDIIRLTLGPNRPEFALSLYEIAGIHRAMGSDDEAEANYVQAYELLSNLYGPQHAQVFDIVRTLATFYMGKDQAKTDLYMDQGLDYVLYQIDETYGLLTEPERLVLKDELDDYVYRYISYGLQRLAERPELADKLQNLALAYKGAAIQTNMFTLANLQSKRTPEFARSFNQWQNLARQIAGAPAGADAQDVAALRKDLTELEQQLLRPNGKAQDQPKIAALRSQLRPGEVLIDFFAVPLYDFDTDTYAPDKTYLAFVNKPGAAHTTVVPLHLNQNVVRTNQLRSQLSYYQQLWQPLESILTGAKTVYICPDEGLHKVSFASMPNNAGSYVADQVDIVRLSRAANLSDTRRERRINGPALLVADVDYAAEADTNVQDPMIMQMNLNAIASDSVRNTISFHGMGTTAQEQAMLTKTLGKKKWRFTALKGGDATEAAVKRSLQGDKPGLIHLATHGYFFHPFSELPSTIEEDTRLRLQSLGNPMLKSGLVLASASKSWKGGFITSSGEDAYLTGFELSMMDLSNTGLVILSNIETGRDNLDNGEAVYTLVKSFKDAGADKVMLSLWRTSDAANQIFLQRYYKNLLKGHSPRAALLATQKKLRKKSDPRDWAGYVLVE